MYIKVKTLLPKFKKNNKQNEHTIKYICMYVHLVVWIYPGGRHRLECSIHVDRDAGALVAQGGEQESKGTC